MTQERIGVILADDHPAVRAGIRQFIERDHAADTTTQPGAATNAMQTGGKGGVACH